MPLRIVFLRPQNWSQLKPYYESTITAVKADCSRDVLETFRGSGAGGPGRDIFETFSRLFRHFGPEGPYIETSVRGGLVRKFCWEFLRVWKALGWHVCRTKLPPNKIVNRYEKCWGAANGGLRDGGLRKSEDI